LKRSLHIESLWIIFLIAASGLVRYYMSMITPWDAHFYKLYEPAYDLIHSGMLPVRLSEMGPINFPYGPALIYLLAPFRLIAQGPEALIHFSIVCEGAAIYLFYRLGRDFYSGPVGLMAGLLYGVSAFALSSAGDFSSPYFASPFFLLFLYSLFQVKIAGRPGFLPVFFVASAVLLQTHLSAFIIIPLVLIVLFQRRKSEALYKWIGLSVIAVIFAPYVIHCVRTYSGEAGMSLRAFANLAEGAGRHGYGLGEQAGRLWTGTMDFVFGFLAAESPIRMAALCTLLGMNAAGLVWGVVGTLRDLGRQRAVRWSKALIWTFLFIEAAGIALVTPILQPYHFTIMNILLTGLVCIALGRVWEWSEAGGEGKGRALGKAAVIILVILAAAVNVKGAVDRARRLEGERPFSFAFQKRVAGELVEMGRAADGPGVPEGDAQLSLLETNVFFVSGDEIVPNAFVTSLSAILREYLDGGAGRRILSARNEHMLVFDRPEKARGILHAGKREGEGLTILRCRSRIDPKTSRVSYGFEEGWTEPGFNDDHWKGRSLPFRVPDKGSMYHPCLGDLDRVEYGEELDLIARRRDDMIERSVKGIDRKLIPEVYARLRLINDRPAGCAALYILSLLQPVGQLATENLESLELWINGRAVDRESISVRAPGKIRIDHLEARLEPGENLIALRFGDYQLFDALVVLDLYRDGECPP